MPIELRHVAPPAAPPSYPRPLVPDTEYERRIQAVRTAAACEWVVVYGDREHAANMAFLCGFDPRFEEAILILGPAEARTLLVGNEGLGYVSSLTVPVEVQLCQSLSLMGQPRERATQLAALLANLGIAAGAQVGVIGWKYLEPEESDVYQDPAFAPALLVDTLRRLVGAGGRVVDATSSLMHPAHGLKAQNGAAQIAQQAWAAERASEAVMRIVRGARPGMSEYEAAGLMGYQGEPHICHMMMVGGDGPIVGLRSPSARLLAEGDGVTTALGYWGGLACRAGLLRSTPDSAFFAQYVVPYFSAIAAWWQSLRIGATGGEVFDAVIHALADAPFRPALNPGHLISIDEWTHTPIWQGSVKRIASGMIFQCDIIPAPMPAGQTLNCEDGVAVADAALRAEIATNYPALWDRIQARRDFMQSQLGIQLSEELLPLSNYPAYFPPFWLAPELVCVVAKH